jgi:hypothetical protein
MMPKQLRNVPGANIRHALTNIRAQPFSTNIWLKNGIMTDWYKNGVIKDKDFAALDRMRQQSILVMQTELAARAKNYRREHHPKQI